MLTDFILTRIHQHLSYTPNEQQEELLHKLCRFLLSTDSERLFLLCGYAGTGKTSLIAGVVQTLHSLSQKTLLLAPTGRAAKVLASYSGMPAYTIHKQIYRQKSMGDFRFGLSFNTHQDTLFIVDEASMIANTGGNEEQSFGTGRLLDDLIEYVYSGRNCSLLLIGDNAQLPPVGQTVSPALDYAYLQGYGLHIEQHTLTQVARQALDSGILTNATGLRKKIAENDVMQPPSFLLDGFHDIRLLQGEEVVEEVERAYQEVGVEETMIVTRTNKRMNLYNQGIRARVLWKEEEISGGDRIMVTRNNYFWTKQYEGVDFLANGDMFEITRLKHFREMYGCHFVDASLHAIDYDWDIDVVLWLETLSTDSPEANYRLQQTLVSRIAEDYPEIHSKKEMWKKIMENPYYNALQVKHAYAVTCHKAQGGQWKRVFIDQGLLAEDQYNVDYYRWLYTALTRATEQVFLINFKQ